MGILITKENLKKHNINNLYDYLVYLSSNYKNIREIGTDRLFSLGFNSDDIHFDIFYLFDIASPFNSPLVRFSNIFHFVKSKKLPFIVFERRGNVYQITLNLAKGLREIWIYDDYLDMRNYNKMKPDKVIKDDIKIVNKVNVTEIVEIERVKNEI